MKDATTNSYGDLVCPGCGLNIMTPPACIVVVGEGMCQVCNAPFRVTLEVAEEANERVKHEED